jgi:Mg-chelatase subunit ChlD
MLRYKDTKEILQKIRRIEIKTSKIVNDLFSGQYSSIFKGRGMEFGEVREYQFGDDIRNIDWNVTARAGKTYIKKYIEERELSVIIMIDMSMSMRFGTVDKFKIEIAAEIASILAFSAIKNNDKVGLLIFTDKVEKYISPNKGKQHILRLIREILFFEPSSKNTDMKVGLKYLIDILKRKSIIFFISDFSNKNNLKINLDKNIEKVEFDYEKEIRVLNKKHDLINIYIFDRFEKVFPKIGYVALKDNETGEILEFNTNDNIFRKNLDLIYKKNEEIFKKFCNRNALEFIEVEANEEFINPILKFFKRRQVKS